MTKKVYYTLFLVLFCSVFNSSVLNAQSNNSQIYVKNWESFTSLYNVADTQVDSEGCIWAATTGGIFKYKPSNKEFLIFRNIDDLISNDISTIAIDQTDGTVYAGSVDGVIEIKPKNEDWVHLTDIKGGKSTNPIINDIKLYKDNFFVAGGFGLVVYKKNERVVEETIFKIGNFDLNINVKKVLIQDNNLYLATNQGLAIAALNSNLSDPESWKTYKDKVVLKDSDISDMYFFNNKLYLASDKKLCTFNNNLFELVHESSSLISGLTSSQEDLYFSDDFGVRTLKGAMTLKGQTEKIKGINFAKLDKFGNTLVINYSVGFGIKKADSVFLVAPDSPSSNRIADISVNRGNVWCATGTRPGYGLMSFDGDNWTNYSSKSHPTIKSNWLHKVDVFDDNTVFAGSWGAGMLVIDDNKNVSAYKNENSVLKGISANDNFVITGESVKDNKGIMWTTNYGEISTGPVLVAFDKNMKSYGFQNRNNNSMRTFVCMDIDQFGTKWMGSASSYDSRLGVYYYNERNTLEDESDDIFGRINTSTHANLYDNAIDVVRVDKMGMVWLGTPKGLSVVINPSAVFSNRAPIIRKVRNVSSQINDIYIDVSNNKWLATNSGIWVMNPDATALLMKINAQNSPLPTDEITSLTVDKSTGKLYIGTKMGLYAAASTSVEAGESFDLSCYPQPFNPNKTVYMTIAGLADASDVKILTTNGEFIKSISTNNGKTIWDGKDQYGNFVQTGVYIIVGTSMSSDSEAVLKCAVIRR